MAIRVPPRLPGAMSVRAWLQLALAMLRPTQGLAFWELASVHRLVRFGS